MKKDARIYRLLVVEDNPGDFVLIEDYLDDYLIHPQIHHCLTYRAAEQALQNPNMSFDLILLDLSLPDLGGEALIEKVIQEAKGIPVVALTGFTDMDFSIRSLSMGVSDYLLKDELTSTMLYKSIVYNIERAKNLKNLIASEQRYSDLFHLSPLPMYVFDFKNRTFLDVNEAALKSYGYTTEEFMQLSLNDIRPPEEIPTLDKMMLVSQETLNQEFQEVQHKKKDGTIFYVNIRAKTIKFNNLPARLVLAYDITEERTYVQTIENQNKILRSIAWMQSHSVRAPLARMMSLIDLAREDRVSVEEYLNLMDISAKELDEVIHNIVQKTGSLSNLLRSDKD